MQFSMNDPFSIANQCRWELETRAARASPRRGHPSRGLLVETRNAFAAFELGEHIRRPQAETHQQNEAMEPQVSHLGRKPQFITVLGSHNHLGSLLAHLFDDGLI